MNPSLIFSSKLCGQFSDSDIYVMSRFSLFTDVFKATWNKGNAKLAGWVYIFACSLPPYVRRTKRHIRTVTLAKPEVKQYLALSAIVDDIVQGILKEIRSLASDRILEAFSSIFLLSCNYHEAENGFEVLNHRGLSICNICCFLLHNVDAVNTSKVGKIPSFNGRHLSAIREVWKHNAVRRNEISAEDCDFLLEFSNNRSEYEISEAITDDNLLHD